MRRVIAEKSVRAGDLVRIHARLGKSEYARLSIWSREGDHDFAPHINEEKAKVLSGGRPMMLQPAYMRLDEFRKRQTLEIRAPRNMSFRVMQEYDHGDLQPKVRIVRYGRIAQAIRRVLRTRKR